MKMGLLEKKEKEKKRKRKRKKKRVKGQLCKLFPASLS